MEEHMSKWRKCRTEDYDKEDYSLNRLFAMPIELIRVLNNDEIAELTKSYLMK